MFSGSFIFGFLGSEMQYFTQELLEKSHSHDPNVAEAAAKEWEKNITFYRSHLEDLKNWYPDITSFLHDFPCFHDCKVVAHGVDKNGDYFFILKPELVKNVTFLSTKIRPSPQKIILKVRTPPFTGYMMSSISMLSAVLCPKTTLFSFPMPKVRS